MNISFNTQSPYSSFYQKGILMGQNSQQRGAGSASPFASGNESQANPLSKFANKVTEDKASISQQMRQMIPAFSAKVGSRLSADIVEKILLQPFIINVSIK